jgi:hypothetical protein
MRRRIVFGFGAFALAVAGSAIHPFGRMRDDRDVPLLEGARIDAMDLDRIHRSCSNCHSERVEWPWYSYAAPVSWLVERDIHTARSRLNLSRWNEYSVEERVTLLSAIGSVAKNEVMPPLRYRALHPESRLSESARLALYEWTRSERRRLGSRESMPLIPTTHGDSKRE